MKFIHQIIRLILVNQNVILFKMVLCKFLLEKVLPFVRKSQINDRKRHTPISHLHPLGLLNFLLHLRVSY